MKPFTVWTKKLRIQYFYFGDDNALIILRDGCSRRGPSLYGGFKPEMFRRENLIKMEWVHRIRGNHRDLRNENIYHYRLS